MEVGEFDLSGEPDAVGETTAILPSEGIKPRPSSIPASGITT